ncbi:hypothetical protein PLAN_70265 [Planktothrix rubescens CCAP 1459/22]|uniref:Uncharacterized protein n=1 Tax=Planktothrix rubescens CCAP 1459/22 TaxID=329571 RepID=A0A6J7ZUN4_PLARU|nr:hypothetical protein PLAN_70265 [Planktothrix rubescens NIVA-CYA 18]CAD0230137.1 hypothetical protein PL10110_480151 [Planktothrix agardhii]
MIEIYNLTLALPLLRGGLGGVNIDGNITTDLGWLYYVLYLKLS